MRTAAILPVKHFTRAKQRLGASVADPLRAELVPAMVADVLLALAEAAAIGLPDPERGEVVRAFVVLKPGAQATEAELIAFVRERIAHYKAPRSIEFRASLPRSGVQKVLRRVLKDEALAAATASTPGASTSPAR